MNLTVSKVNNGFTVSLRNNNSLCVLDKDVYVARDEDELMTTLRDIIMSTLVIEKLTGEEINNVPF